MSNSNLGRWWRSPLNSPLTDTPLTARKHNYDWWPRISDFGFYWVQWRLRTSKFDNWWRWTGRIVFIFSHIVMKNGIFPSPFTIIYWLERRQICNIRAINLSYHLGNPYFHKELKNKSSKRSLLLSTIPLRHCKSNY